MKVKYQNTKTLITKPNNNSSDAISSNYIYGCAGNCSSYCYMKRYNQNKLYVNTNIDEIEKSVSNWVNTQPWPKVPNQQDNTYYMIDIGCNTDISLHQKHLGKAVNTFMIEKLSRDESVMLDGLEYILSFYNNHPKLNSTFATKYPNLLTLNVNGFNKKPRVRVSLMPQKYSDILEPKMQSISSRIKDINRLQNLGWEIHINFSPVICYPNWLEEYDKLFKEIKEKAGELKSEVIFLTNHINQMTNASNEAQELMKYSSEVKNSSGVMRYPLKYKSKLIDEFKQVYSNYFNINTIRYIF